MAEVKIRSTHSKAIEKQLKFATDLDVFNAATVEELEMRSDALQKHWEKFENAHYEVLTAIKEDNCEMQDKIFDEAEDQYIECAAIFKTRMKELNKSKAAQEATQAAAIQVEVSSSNFGPVHIDEFNGDYADWRRFYDTFKAMIHDKTNIPDVIKFARLISFLGPDVKAFVSGYQNTAENYQVAWKALQERYDNKSRIIDAHLTRLMSLPYANRNDAKSLKHLLDTINEIVRQLSVLKVPVSSWDVLLVHLLMSHIDFDTRSDWELTRAGKPKDEVATFAEVVLFLERKASSIEFMQHKQVEEAQVVSSSMTNCAQGNARSKAKVCHLCKERHLFHRCQQFQQLPIMERWKVVRAANICANCFRDDHNTENCSRPKCFTCGRERHNSWLCAELEQRKLAKSNVHFLAKDIDATTKPFTNTPQLEMAAEKSNPSGSEAAQQRHTLLATACVLAEASDKRQVAVRALCDTGSQLNLVTSDCVKRLGLQMKGTKTAIHLAGGECFTNLQGEVELTLSPAFESNFSLKIHASVLPKITSVVPTMLITNDWPSTNELQLADKNFRSPRHIDILLGAGAWASIVKDKVISGEAGSPTAQDTKFGFVVFGEVAVEQHQSLCNMLALNTNERLLALLEKFWEINEPQKASQLTPDEQKCENFFSETTTRDKEGRYVVRLPLKKTHSDLGNSFAVAARRLSALENKFERNKEFEHKFRQFLDEYGQLGHLKSVKPEVPEPSIKYYIPTHAVENPKFRVVFDASTKTSEGISLNDIMYVGPRLQDDLFEIIIRFRYHKVSLVADIVKMFRQVRVHQDDQPLQRILWRDSPKDKISILQLTTVTYGTAAAPYLAIRALRQCALDYAEEYPLAKQAVLRDFNVDDLLTGANSVEEAGQLFKELTAMLQKAGFSLDKWTTNNAILAKLIESTNIDAKAVQTEDSTVLGMRWNPRSDVFTWKIQLKPCKKVTKREITSRVGMLFDPIGYLQPIIIRAKGIIQQLWKKGGSWDEEVSADIKVQWDSFQGELKALEGLEIQRWLGTTPISIIKLHGFCDASNIAYAAVVYVETISPDGRSVINMVTAKSRVAPLKSTSTPRLELCAAVLLSDLQDNVVRLFEPLHSIQIVEKTFWSDSTIVLYWLQKQPWQLKTYVSNRVAKIQECTKGAEWRHVPSADNPADAASRGIKAIELINSCLWWAGPEWLPFKSKWPALLRPLSTEHLQEAEKEEKPEILVSLMTKQKTLLSDGSGIGVLERHSSLHKVKRVVALVTHFILCIKDRINKRSLGDVIQQLKQPVNQFIVTSKKELDDALIIVLRFEQKMHLAAEWNTLTAGKALENSSIIHFKPFLDENNLLRMGSRIEAMQAPYDTRYPIIVPHDGRIIQLLIDEAHKVTMHGGVQLVQQYLRERYCFKRSRQIIRSRIRRCVICARYQAATCKQQMASLPEFHVQQAPPFTHTGVDYAGPVRLKAYDGARKKITSGYICIFVCMVTRAVHIEVVSDLSTKAFLAAFNRFCARRGNCTNLYSDNGTTFIGAARQLDEIYNSWQSDETTKALSTKGIIWKFITPAAPHQGGMWESAVKSAKHHLRRVTNGHLMTYEQLSTVTSQIEACLNSRPMFALTDDPADTRVIAPADLLGTGPIVTPLVNKQTLEMSDNPSKRLAFLQWLVADFWQKWNKDYLAGLQSMNKWHATGKNLQKDDLVLIKDEKLPPAQWAMGRISKVYPGHDGLVRNVTVRTAVGELDRAIQKLVRLPIENNVLSTN